MKRCLQLLLLGGLSLTGAGCEIAYNAARNIVNEPALGCTTAHLYLKARRLAPAAPAGGAGGRPGHSCLRPACRRCRRCRPRGRCPDPSFDPDGTATMSRPEPQPDRVRPAARLAAALAALAACLAGGCASFTN